jgi:predicted nucleic acid-binding protein
LNKVCIDASLAVSWLTYSNHTPAANLLRQEWAKNGVEFVGPTIFHAEVMSALRELVLDRKMLPEEADEALSICLAMPIRTVGGEDVYRTAWRVSSELDLRFSWASQYLAVAELENCEYWTVDRRLVGLAREKRTWVKWLGDYGKDSAQQALTPKRDNAPTPDNAPKRYGSPGLDDPGLWRKF